MVLRQVQIHLGQKSAGVVGAVDRAVVFPQRPVEPRVHKAPQAVVHPLDVALPGISQHLLVVRGEKERLVPDQRATEREAELPLSEAGPAFRATVPRDFGQGIVLAEEMRRSAQCVGARLGDDVDESAAGAPEFRVGSLGNHNDFRDGVQIEGEGRALTPALLAEEGVVEIGAVYRDIVVDAALSGNGQFVSVRPLDDAHAWSQEREIEKISPVVGQILYRLLGQAGGRLGPGDVDGGPSGHNDELLHLNNHLDNQFHGFTDPDLHACLAGIGPSLRPYRHVVETERQKGRGEQTQFGRREDSPVIGTGLPENDGGASDGIIELIAYKAPDHTRGRLGLGARRAVHQSDRHQEEGQRAYRGLEMAAGHGVY